MISVKQYERFIKKFEHVPSRTVNATIEKNILRRQSLHSARMSNSQLVQIIQSVAGTSGQACTSNHRAHTPRS